MKISSGMIKNPAFTPQGKDGGEPEAFQADEFEEKHTSEARKTPNRLADLFDLETRPGAAKLSESNTDIIIPIAGSLITENTQSDKTIKFDSDISITSSKGTDLDGIRSTSLNIKSALPKLENISDSIENLQKTTQDMVLLSSSSERVLTNQGNPKSQIATNFTALPTNHPAVHAVGNALVQLMETQKGITLRLDPPEMGRVFIEFQFEADKSVTAIIRTEIAETALQLKDKLNLFQQSLKDSGFTDVALSFSDNTNSAQNPFNFEDKKPKSILTTSANELSTEKILDKSQTHIRKNTLENSQLDMKL